MSGSLGVSGSNCAAVRITHLLLQVGGIAQLQKVVVEVVHIPGGWVGGLGVCIHEGGS